MNLLQAVRKGNLDYVEANIESDIWFKNTPWSDYILLNNSIQFNRFKISSFLLERNGCRVNRTDTDVPESTPLHRAIAKNNVDLVVKLLNAGASVTARNENDETPVHLAVKSRKPVQIVNALGPYVITAPNLINTYGLTHLHVLCMSNQRELGTAYIRKHGDVNRAVSRNSPHKPGFTPLHFAVHCGRNYLAYNLLSDGADCHAVDANGVTPLHLAFRKKKRKLVYFMVRTSFLNFDRYPVINPVDDMDISYFHIICSQYDWVTHLDRYMAYGIDINGRISFSSSHLPGCTPLHVAVQYKCRKTILLLLRHGADITLRNAAGFTPVHHAFWMKEFDLIDLFMHDMVRVGENLVDREGVSFFHIICLRDNPYVIQSFINMGVDVNLRIRSSSSWLASCTPLHLAVRFEQPRNVDVLLRNHANVYLKDVKGETPLHYLCQWNADKIDTLAQVVRRMVSRAGDLNVLRAHLTKKLQILRLFVNLGVTVDVFDKAGLTPLFHLFNQRTELAVCNRLDKNVATLEAINRNRLEMFKLVLNLRPNFALRDRLDFTLLHRLAEREYGSFIPHQGELAPPMLEDPEVVDAVNSSRKTALYMAVENSNEELVDILLERSKPNVNFRARGVELGTPLACAIWTLMQRIRSIHPYKPNIVNKLIEHGADVNARLNNGSTALHFAVGSGMFGQLAEYMILPVVDCDLENQERNTGWTPLHVATRAADVQAVDWLLRAGAPIDVEDREGFIPLAHCAHQDPLRTGPAYIRHHLRLRTVGLRSPIILQMFSGMFSGHIERYTDKYEEQCLKEIKGLKKFRLNQYCTMYDFLFKSTHRMVYYVNNEEVSAIIRQELCRLFPQYGPLIASRFRKALARHKIQDEAVCAFNTLTELPTIISDLVLEHCSDVDAKNVILAANLKRSKRKKACVKRLVLSRRCKR